MIKRYLVIFAAVLLLLVLALGGLVYAAFAGARPLVDGEELPGARTVKDGFVGLFVLDAGDGALVLIDAGVDEQAAAIRAELARRKAPIDAVKAVFLTHGHRDHVHGLRALPNAQIYAFPAEQPFLDGRENYRSPMARLGSREDAGVRIQHALGDGEVVRIGSLEVQAFAIPGHTQGSAAYLANGVLYLGDSADAGTDGTIRPAKWVFSDDQAQNVASLKRLVAALVERKAVVTKLAFAHSGPADGLAPLKAFTEAH